MKRLVILLALAIMLGCSDKPGNRGTKGTGGSASIPEPPFKNGQVVEVKLTGEKVCILYLSNSRNCFHVRRAKLVTHYYSSGQPSHTEYAYTQDYFYIYELQEVADGEEDPIKL